MQSYSNSFAPDSTGDGNRLGLNSNNSPLPNSLVLVFDWWRAPSGQVAMGWATAATQTSVTVMLGLLLLPTGFTVSTKRWSLQTSYDMSMTNGDNWTVDIKYYASTGTMVSLHRFSYIQVDRFGDSFSCSTGPSKTPALVGLLTHLAQ
jgi:hypothetical protein